jgi:hypothetical protein
MHEQHAERGWRGSWNRQRAIHLGVAARLKHEATAVEIEPADGVMALLQDGGTAGLWKAFKDETHWLAAGMHLDGTVGGGGAGSEIRHGRGWIARNEAFVGSFVDNAPTLELEARFRAEGCPRG